MLPEKNPDTNIEVQNMDDYGNLLVSIRNPKQSTYFINELAGKKIRLYKNRKFILRNKSPIEADCLPGKIKKSIDNEPYFAPGLWDT